ncbi:D-amino acid dehydrogenase [Oharaeibacter diazotrophicus]|uniref:D-amino acid dehydrogenase n=1 Tax=Oharaeibacter diazotrophicus TaxID=1920512 RepID=A0A4R6R5A6_9HYPH|nr:D-amino acid dehydrogenase [Oharaeibacter diazotrophicus]TDP81111.1 D-amino acid dehydrogenase small subunit [Oharaeibacter diazotrophicus]BBE74895.1 D-amino acid dehydrogenase small subunit [Pleomorphomonas sp. SM30]GLS75600.1 D-amino acid dehydrogenase [Oharaeibacter diazotrophicus]
MKVAVLGSGVVGVTTAYYLAAAGHEVEVIDRQPGPGLETSFANAGEISPGYASPWAAPGIPQKAVKWLFMRHAPLILRPTLDPDMYRWLAAMLANCTAGRYAVNKGRMVRLAEYSRDRLIALRQRTAIRYDERSMGTLQLFRSDKQLAAADKDIAVLRADGVPFEVLDADGCIRAEPALAAVRGKFVGGLRLPNDETGDCFKFTNALAALAAETGVVFRHGVRVDGFERDGDRIAAVRTSAGTVTADAVVAAMGSYTPRALGALGIRVPVYPVKGYSITAQILDESRAPVSTVMDETFKVAITRLGDRIRVGGMAEISGFSTDLPTRRRGTLEHSVGDLFPGGGDLAGASFWSGLRPMTPDGTPVIGATKYRNLWLNTGHGTLGWTMACGSAAVLADLIGGRRPEIPADDLALSRYAA